MSRFTDTPPPVVLPDTELARKDLHIYADQGLPPEFCSDFEVDHNFPSDTATKPCANRRCDGDKSHSWCFKCPAGYMFWLK